MPNPYLHHVLKKKDSIRYKSRFSQKLDQFTDSRLYRMTYIGVPLIVGGLAVKSEDDHFRSLRNDYLPRFHHHADDYLQYAPAAVMLEMKNLQLNMLYQGCRSIKEKRGRIRKLGGGFSREEMASASFRELAIHLWMA